MTAEGRLRPKGLWSDDSRFERVWLRNLRGE
jgi:hypothetical protein